MKVYISGAISSIGEEVARPLFEAKERELRAEGYEPVNPMKLPHQHSKSWAEFMAEDMAALRECQCMYVMRGYQKSIGVDLEIAEARRLGIPIRFEE